MDSEKDIDRLVAARIERQHILAGAMPPVLWYVIDEGVLRHIESSREIMVAQLDKLLEASATPGIVIQILPFTADHPGTDGPISVYEFNGKPAVDYTECYSGGRIVEGPEVADLVTMMNMLRVSALPQRESRGLIRQIRSEIDEQ